MVSNDVIRVALYNWECQDELIDMDDENDDDDDDETTDAISSWKIVSPYPPQRLMTKTSHNNEEQENDGLDFPTSTWRLTLDVTSSPTNSSNQSPEKEEQEQDKEDNEDETLPFHFQKQVCVRWMLHNLPLSHEYSMEVTFQRTQLQIDYDVVMPTESTTTDATTTTIAIQTVQVAFPEEVGVDVHVDGRGRAVVYDAEL